MNLLAFIKNWKDFSLIWALIQPFVKKLLEKNVPNTITKLYENFIVFYFQFLYNIFINLRGCYYEGS